MKLLYNIISLKLFCLLGEKDGVPFPDDDVYIPSPQQDDENKRLKIACSEEYKRHIKYIRIQLKRIHHKSILRS